MIEVNKHVQGLKPSATLAINQKVKYLRSRDERIFHFGFGQSPFPIHYSIVNALKDNATNNHYLPTVGLELLRETIAEFLQEFQDTEAHSEYIYIGPGSKELLYQTILILEGTFLIPKGSWVSYLPQIKIKNGKYSILETTLENNFKLSPEALETYCIANPNGQKSLILNSPNNPTGAVYSNEELQNLSEVCRRHNIIVLSDEIYSQINFKEINSPSISKFYPEKTMVFGSLSKVFSAGGYRLGFMTLPKDLQFLHTTYRSLFSETFSAVASPVQYAAIEAYEMNKGLQDYIKNCKVILSGVADFVFTKLSEANVQCTRPQGAFYMMVGFNRYKDKIWALGIESSKELANYLLDKYKVALLPSTDFYFEEDELFFRLAYVDFDGEEVFEAYKNGFDLDERFIEKYCSNVYYGIQKIVEFVEEL